MRWLDSAVPEWLQIVLAAAGAGTLAGTALALILVIRFPNLHHWRFIGVVSVLFAGAAVLVLVLREL